MAYTLDPNNTPNPLLPWNRVFTCLSIEQFNSIYDALDFPFRPLEDVRLIAHDFAFTYYKLLARHPESEYRKPVERLVECGEINTYNLLSGTMPSDPSVKLREVLFENTFSHLERLGYAEAIYQWGKQTQTYIRFADRLKLANIDVIAGWCNLLRVWAVLQWLEQPLSPNDTTLYSDDWEKIIAKWKPFYVDYQPQPLTTAPLSLPQSTRLALQAHILHHEARRLHFMTAVEQMMNSPKTDWEDFVLRQVATYADYKNEGRYRINLQIGRMIVQLLSAAEMTVLEEWAAQHAHQYRGLKVPFPRFDDFNSND